MSGELLLRVLLALVLLAAIVLYVWRCFKVPARPAEAQNDYNEDTSIPYRFDAD